MLVLSRKRHEWIAIGADIRICVVEIRSGGIVRIGIEAPADVNIRRDELPPVLECDLRDRRTWPSADDEEPVVDEPPAPVHVRRERPITAIETEPGT